VAAIEWLSHVVEIIAEIILQVILAGLDKKQFVCFRKPVDRITFIISDNG
jgi:hypothetical protein